MVGVVDNNKFRKYSGSIPRNACVAWKHTFGKCDRRTDRQTDEQSDPYVSLCFAGDTIK